MKSKSLDKKANKILKDSKKLTPFQRKIRADIKKEQGI